MSRQPAKGSRAPAELFAFYLKAWNLDADPAELVDRVRAIEGVVRAEFNPQAKRLIVLSTLDQSVLLEALAGLGLEVEAEDGEEERQSPALPSPGAVRVRLRERLSERFPGADDWLRTVAWLVPASFLVGVLLSVLATVGRPAPVFWLALAGAALAGFGVLVGTRRLLRRPEMTLESRLGRPDTTLCLLIVLVALLLSGRWVDSLLLVPLYAVVQSLPGYVLRRLGSAWHRPQDDLPRSVRLVAEDGGHEAADSSELPFVDVESVEPGAVIVVSEGEIVPLDGRVQGENEAVVSRSTVTGESIPSIPPEGTLVPAGAVVESGTLVLRVERPFAEGTIFALRPRGLFEGTLEERLTEFGTALVRRTPQVVVYAATLVMLVPPLLFGEAVGPWIHRGLAVLLIAPVNSLIFALLGPVLSARTALARLGGVVDSHDALSALGRATRLTLSHSLVMDPRFTLTRVEPLVPMGEDDALQIAASLLAGEEHPWGAAFAEAAEGHGLELAPPIHRSDFDGEGLVGKLRTGDEEDEFAIGTTAWMQRLGVQLPGDLDERLDQAAREGSCLIWLAYGGRAMAVFALQSRVKDGTRRLVQRLKKAGVRSVCLLSTRESPLIERFADQAGMDGGYGELTADQAEALLAQWREAGERVALVVGPESPVESDAAEVTVRFDAETPVQTEAGHIRVVTEDVSQLYPLFALARRFRRSSGAALALVLAAKAAMALAVWRVDAPFMLIGAIETGTVLLVAAFVLRLQRTV